MTEKEIDFFYREVGQNIKIARRNRSLSQTDFAKLLNLSRASIANIEMGRQKPSLHLISIISTETNVSIENLLPILKNEQQDLSILEDKISEYRGKPETKQKLSDFVSKI